MTRHRLDELLVQRGLYSSRSRARDAIASGGQGELQRDETDVADHEVDLVLEGQKVGGYYPICARCRRK